MNAAVASPARIQTTVVGSYPLPAWLAALPNTVHLRDAVLVVLKTQELVGIDVVTDGELSRFDVNHPETNGMIDYFVRPLQGVRSTTSRAELETFRRQPGMGFRAQPAGVVHDRIAEGTLILPGLLPREDASVIHDISPRVSPRLAVWPGDTPLSRTVLLELGKPSADDSNRVSNITLSTLHATVHLGAHADAPSHYGPGQTIDQRDLDYYLGPCQLMHVHAPRGARLTLSMLPDPLLASRLLLATGTYPDPESFNADFAALSVELIDFLHDQGVVLVGIDTPSVDLFDSKDLEAHRAFLRHDMAILEGLALAGVPAGLYELIALPLRLEGFDASPVRAVLRR